MDQKKQFLVVLGTHRSGTSALTRSLRVFGVELGTRLMEANPDNLRGYWEDLDLVALNSEMQETLDRDWNHFCELDTVRMEELQERFFDRGKRLLLQKTEGRSLVAWKDPRLCGLLPFWKTVFTACNIEPRFLLSTRNPQSVISSLSIRNQLSHTESEWIWISDMLANLANTKGSPRIVVDYENLLANPEVEISRMAGFLNRPVDTIQLKELLENFLTPKLNHHPASAMKAVSVSMRSREIYEHLKQAAATSRVEIPDQVVEKWQSEFAPVKGLLEGLRDRDRQLQRERALSQERLQIIKNQTASLKNEDLRTFEFLKSLAKLTGEDPWLIERNWKFTPDDLCRKLENLLRQRDEEIQSLKNQNQDLASSLASFEKWQQSWARRAFGRWHRFPNDHQKGFLRRVVRVLTKPWRRCEERTGQRPAEVPEDPAPAKLVDAGGVSGPPSQSQSQSSHEWLKEHWAGLTPVATFPSQGNTLRLSILTDSVDSSSLFGGVATALIVGALTANRTGATLRLITRTQPPDSGALQQVLSANKLTLLTNFEVIHAPLAASAEVPITPSDRFLTTSWWTTECALGQIPENHIVHLLQEDERMFYPHGDWRRRCHNLLNRSGLHLLVNSRLLFDALGEGVEPLRDLESRATWFEPAFPGLPVSVAPSHHPRRLFFYARPKHSRNLFALGLEALTRASEEGILTANEWEVYFVGAHVPKLSLPGDIRVHWVEGLNWTEYQTLVASMDAGFVLMDTPHPSYPPLDLAAAGASVLTCRHGNKKDLGFYSKNILTAEPTVPDLTAGLAQLLEAAKKKEERTANARTDAISRDWNRSLESAVQFLEDIYFGDSIGRRRVRSQSDL